MPLRSPLLDETAPLRRIAADHPGLRSPAEWLQDAERVLARPRRSRRPPAVVALHIVEHDRIESHFGRRGIDELLSQIAWIVDGELTDADRMGTDGRGGLTVLLSNTATAKVHERLERVIRRLARRELLVDGELVRITPVLGWTSAADGPPSERHDLVSPAGSPPHISTAQLPAGRTGEPPEYVQYEGRLAGTPSGNLDPPIYATDSRRGTLVALAARAAAAADAAQQQMDLVPRRWTPEMSAPPSHDGVRRPAQLTTALQVLVTFAVGIGLPLILLMTAHLLGVDLAMPAYYTVMAALVFTATIIWMENFRALDPPRPPERPAGPYPRASVVIPAYLPNEAATIIETLRYVLAQDYPGPLQVILAYNTPQPLQVEDELKAMAALDRRLVVMRVPFSTSKAQNVNAALQVVNGEFTAIFDADHHPRRDALTRAWRWISHGADVVQGHCVVRNGRASLVARTVAVEFESIYAVSHPGRAGLHGFGVFGGSNGYWRTSVLHETRMRAEMLTEDIDSSIRLILHGYTVVNDPGLLSYELAPATFGALWHQRIRWAQGWFQVARRHLKDGLRSDLLSMRNRLGMAFLLGWREVYPWISLLIVPVIVFMAWRMGGVTQLDFLVPSLVLASLYTFAIGPAQALFAWRLAAPEVRRYRRWFFCYLLLAPAYTELRNVIARVAQLKELTGERRWVITPRPQAAPSGPVGS